MAKDKLTARKDRDQQISTLQRQNEVDAASALDAIAEAFNGGTASLSDAIAVLTQNVPLLTIDTNQHQFQSVLQNMINVGDVASQTAQSLRDRHAQTDAMAAAVAATPAA